MDISFVCLKASPCSLVILRKEGEKRCWGETPNATWRDEILRKLPEHCQHNLSQERRSAFRSPHGNDKSDLRNQTHRELRRTSTQAISKRGERGETKSRHALKRDG